MTVVPPTSFLLVDSTDDAAAAADRGCQSAEHDGNHQSAVPEPAAVADALAEIVATGDHLRD